jgi:threonine/homoserine/homoserine lactone efflux protein
MDVFLQGLLVGFSIAAPVGPIGVLCIRRTFSEGRLSGLLSGLGAASADALYGCVAAFGLTAVSSLLVEWQTWLRLVGGLFLVYLGIRTFISSPAEDAAQTSASGRLEAYLSTFVLTLTNPMTILSFAAIFAGLGLATAQNAASAVWMVAGVFLGSAAWWLALSTGVSMLRNRFQASALVWVNRISGVIILSFGIAALASTL